MICMFRVIHYCYFRNRCIDIYELELAKNFSVQGLTQQAALKKTKIKLDLLTDTDKFLMMEKEIRGGICNTIYWYAKANNRYMKDYDQNKESSDLNYWDVNNLYGWAM